MLMPKKVKFRKQQKGKMRGKAWVGSKVSFGDFGLKALECGYITDRQIEAGRIAISRYLKRNGRIWIRMFPDKPVTKKPQETRMGKGKGAPDHWVFVAKPGRTTHTHSSGAPLPLPMRVSCGFFVIGLSGNTRIQTLPPRLMVRVMATRLASIWRSVIQATSMALSP